MVDIKAFEPINMSNKELLNSMFRLKLLNCEFRGPSFIFLCATKFELEETQ